MIDKATGIKAKMIFQASIKLKKLKVKINTTIEIIKYTMTDKNKCLVNSYSNIFVNLLIK